MLPSKIIRERVNEELIEEGWKHPESHKKDYVLIEIVRYLDNEYRKNQDEDEASEDDGKVYDLYNEEDSDIVEKGVEEKDTAFQKKIKDEWENKGKYTDDEEENEDDKYGEEYKKVSEPCCNCRDRFSPEHLDEQEKIYGKRICTVCIAKLLDQGKSEDAYKRGKGCESWCGGSCDGESGVDYCGNPECPGIDKEPYEEKVKRAKILVNAIPQKNIKVGKKKEKEKLEWLK